MGHSKCGRLALVLACILLGGASRGQETDLPRVLLLGDSIYAGPSRECAKELKGKVEVVYRQLEPGVAFTTANVLEHFDKLIDTGDESKSWDLIHFNVGLGDLTYRTPGLKSFRVLSRNAGGIRNSTLEEYQTNLKMLVQRLKQIDAPLVWASTTPIRSSVNAVFEPGSEVEFNRVAEDLMRLEKVPVNDMHSKIYSLIDRDRRSSFDPFDFDKKPLHPMIIEVIVQQLDLE